MGHPFFRRLAFKLARQQRNVEPGASIPTARQEKFAQLFEVTQFALRLEILECGAILALESVG